MYGYEIDVRMKELGITSRQLAKEVGVSTTEIEAIRDDERQWIRKSIFLKLMKCLNLNPREFGGFARLDFMDSEDFLDGKGFIEYVCLLMQEKGIPARYVADAIGITEAQMSRLLHFKRTTISVDQFVYWCNYMGMNYQDYLCDKVIVPSFYDETMERKIKLSQLQDLTTSLDTLELEDVIQYTNCVIQKSNKVKQKVR